jgi:hypothetical protein
MALVIATFRTKKIAEICYGDQRREMTVNVRTCVCAVVTTIVIDTSIFCL